MSRLTEEHRNHLLQISNPNLPPEQRVNVYLPVDVDNEIIYDGNRRYLENQHIRTQHLQVQDKTVLDIGCNTGYISKFCAKNGAKYVLGVDNDEKIIRVANYIKLVEEIENLEYILMDKYQLSDNTDYDFPFDIGLNLSNLGYEITLSDLERYGHLAKVWYIEPTNHEHWGEGKTNEEIVQWGESELSRFGDVEFLTHTDYQNRGLFKLIMK